MNEAAVLGCSRVSSVKRTVPQLVCRVAVYWALRATFSGGRSSSPSGFGFGAATFGQPDADGWAAAAAPVSAVDVVFLSFEEPHPASTAAAASRAMRGRTA